MTDEEYNKIIKEQAEKISDADLKRHILRIPEHAKRDMYANNSIQGPNKISAKSFFKKR
jgi:hypothetical protein